MSSCFVKKVDLIENIYRFHIGCGDPGTDAETSLGYIDLYVNEVDPAKINDPIFQKIIMRNYMHRRRHLVS